MNGFESINARIIVKIVSNELGLHTPAERKLVFWSDLWPKPPWELGLGQGPSEKCIWKIFYRAILEILKAEGPLKTKYAISLVFIG